ncbi:cobalt-zinc-cadmium resistance protein CzcA [Bosea sp. BIWAKO-01]|nr:cobalt-zinc-cadmium resistance protein CzcA [Bosea sp. BIWAKO-01]
MTMIAIMAGPLPILWNTGTGSELMQRITMTMIGGMVSSTMLTLLVIPVISGSVAACLLPPQEKPGAPWPIRCVRARLSPPGGPPPWG